MVDKRITTLSLCHLLLHAECLWANTRWTPTDRYSPIRAAEIVDDMLKIMGSLDLFFRTRQIMTKNFPSH